MREKEQMPESYEDTVQRHKKVAESLQQVGGHILERTFDPDQQGQPTSEQRESFKLGMTMLVEGVAMERIAMDDFRELQALGEDTADMERLARFLGENFQEVIHPGETPVEMVERLLKLVPQQKLPIGVPE